MTPQKETITSITEWCEKWHGSDYNKIIADGIIGDTFYNEEKKLYKIVHAFSCNEENKRLYKIAQEYFETIAYFYTPLRYILLAKQMSTISWLKNNAINKQELQQYIDEMEYTDKEKIRILSLI
jgi:hypothetical protein